MAPTASGAKKRRGRPPGSRNSGAAAKAAPKPTKAKPAAKPTKGKSSKARPKTRKQRPAQPEPEPEAEDEDEDELSGLLAGEAPAARPRKRKAHTERDDVAEDEPQPRKKYVQLEARTKRIPQELVDTWPKVSNQVLEQIEAVMRDAKKDIANTQRDERRVMAAHNTLNPLVRDLTRRLAASRIPPQAKDIHFNIDKLTERNALVSREVTTARHSKHLLSEQVKVAEHMLGKDEENLDELKMAAKKWRTEWKHQKKHGRIHPLLEASDETTEQGDRPDDIALRRSTPTDITSLDTPDAELAPMLEQLQRSLENMQGNHAHVEGITGAMGDARAALDDVLFRHASAQQYAML